MVLGVFRWSSYCSNWMTSPQEQRHKDEMGVQHRWVYRNDISRPLLPYARELMRTNISRDSERKAAQTQIELQLSLHIVHE